MGVVTFTFQRQQQKYSFLGGTHNSVPIIIWVNNIPYITPDTKYVRFLLHLLHVQSNLDIKTTFVLRPKWYLSEVGLYTKRAESGARWHSRCSGPCIKIITTVAPIKVLWGPHGPRIFLLWLRFNCISTLWIVRSLLIALQESLTLLSKDT